MLHQYFNCDADQRLILDSIPHYFLTPLEHVNFYFMMHQRSKLRSPDFMAGFESELLARKFSELMQKCPQLRDIDLDKTFIEFRAYEPGDIDRESFQAKLRDVNHPPIVVKQLLKDSVAVQKWSHHYLMEHYPDVEIIAMDYSKSGAYKNMKLADIVRLQLDDRSTASYYINNSAELFRDHPRLVDEIGAQRILELFEGHSVNSFSQVFIGNLRTWGTDWHQGNDISGAFMIHGSKRWFFMDPRLGYVLKPILDGSNGMRTLSEVRLSLDYQRIHNPLYAYAPKYCYDIEPGDAIFFTKFWPHAVMNLTPLQIMANMRMTEVDLQTMQKGNATATLMPMYDNILNSDPAFIRFKFDVFNSLGKQHKDVGDRSYFAAFATAEPLVNSLKEAP